MKTTAIPVPRLQVLPWSRLIVRLPHFIALTKPRVMLLAVFTALVGLFVAPAHLDPLFGSIAQFLALPRELALLVCSYVV